MKRIISALLLIAFCATLTACGKHEPVTLYTDDLLSLAKLGDSISVFDKEEGKAYVFTTRRIRRNKNAVVQGKNCVATKSATIYPAGGLLVIVEKDSGSYIYFRVRKTW